MVKYIITLIFIKVLCNNYSLNVGLEWVWQVQ